MVAALRAALALPLLLVLLAAPAAGQVYRWVDKEGNVHFGEAPPPGARAELWEGGPRERLTIVPKRPEAPAAARPALRQRAPAARDSSEDERAEKIAGKYEWQWREKSRQYQGRIDSIEAKLERERSRSASSWTSSMSAARWEARQQNRIEELERELAQAEEALDEFEEYAREQGAPPGWVR